MGLGKLINLLLLASFYASAVLAAPLPFPGSCTPTPASITIAPGKSAAVSYQCSDTANYQLTFSSTLTGLTVTSSLQYQSNPHQVTIAVPETAAPGQYSVSIASLYLGAGVPFDVTNQTPLTVQVSGTPAPTIPTITWTTPNLQVQPVGNNEQVSWNADATVTKGAITYTLQLNGAALTTNASTPYTLHANQLQSGENTVTVIAVAGTAKPVSASKTFTWTPHPPPPPSVSAQLSCPSTIEVNKAASCLIVLTNATATAPKDVSLLFNLVSGQGTFDPTSGACASGTPTTEQSCEVPFTFTPSAVGTATVGATYSDAEKDTVSINPVTITVTAAPKPEVSAGSLSCSPTTVQVGQTSACQIIYINAGAADATNVSLSPTISPVVGNIALTQSCNVITKDDGTCTAVFTYTAPASISTDSETVTLTVAYSDAENKSISKNTTIAVAGKTPPPPPSGTPSSNIVTTISNQCEARVGCTSGSPALNSGLPHNYVSLTNQEALQLPLSFMFTNTVNTEFYYSTPVVTVIDAQGGEHNLVSTQTSCQSGQAAIFPNKNAACYVWVTFNPSDINAKHPGTFNTGDRVIVKAIMHFDSDEKRSPYRYYTEKTFQVIIGDAPIYAEVRTNRFFINDPSQTGALQGAFVFQNNSGKEINAKNGENQFGVTQSLPAGFKVKSCSSALLQSLNLTTNYKSCNAINTLPAYTDSVSLVSCVACFKATNPGSIDTNQAVAATLLYQQSAATISRTLIALPTHRQLTLKNYCQGPVWAAFVSGAAYQTCERQNECPLGTTCDVSKKQCIQNFIQNPVAAGCAKVGASCTYNSNQGTCRASNVTSTGYACIPNNFDQCPPSSSYDQVTGLCFWNMPTTTDTAPGVASYTQIPSGGTSIKFTIPNVAKNNAGYVWSGGLVGRTGCSLVSGQLVCLTGNCVSDPTNGNCQPGNGPQPPATQAEFTLQLNTQDYYDIEIIDGFNIPVTMAPTTLPSNLKQDTSYICGMAGAVNQVGPKSSMCLWNFSMKDGSTGTFQQTTPAYRAMHYLVTPPVTIAKKNKNGGACTPGATAQGSCADSTNVCGIAQANIKNIKEGTDGQLNAQPSYTCGKLIGFWSTNLLCSFNNSKSEPYYRNTELACGKKISSSIPKAFWLGCNTGISKTSCYGDINAGDNCCGCPFWGVGDGHPVAFPSGYTPSDAQNLQAITFLNNLFKGYITVPYPNSDKNVCKSYNLAWVNDILVKDLAWMKQGCPSAYTFAYDDATSTFTCNNADPQDPPSVNSQDYTITFCPGNIEGTIDQQPINTNPSGVSSNRQMCPCPPSALSSKVCPNCSSSKQLVHHEGLWLRVLHDIRSWLL